MSEVEGKTEKQTIRKQQSDMVNEERNVKEGKWGLEGGKWKIAKWREES